MPRSAMARRPAPAVVGNAVLCVPHVRNNPVNFTDPTGHRPASGCEYEGCTLDDAFDPNHTYKDNNNSPALVDPMLSERYPAEITVGEVAFTTAGLATAGFAPVAIEALVASWPSLASGGSAACADGDCTNEIKALQTGAHAVYQYVENGVTRYIGITNNMARRASEHFVGKGWRIEPVPGLDKLSKVDARAVEQVLIEFHGLDNLYNKINSIASSNRIYTDAIKRGVEILDAIGFFN